MYKHKVGRGAPAELLSRERDYILYSKRYKNALFFCISSYAGLHLAGMRYALSLSTLVVLATVRVVQSSDNLRGLIIGRRIIRTYICPSVNVSSRHYPIPQ